VKNTGWIGVLLLAFLPHSSAQAGFLHGVSDAPAGFLQGRFESKKAKQQLETKDWEHNHISDHLNGMIIDYTHNHGRDNRIWSAALYQKRDLYVYLPPGYDPKQRYPLLIWLHGFAQDEQSFLYDVAPLIDEAISEHKLPPLIVAAPDGSLEGEPCLFSPGSFFLNSKAGDFQDFVLLDVWDFVVRHYPVRPERQAHFIAGVSMGGLGAYNIAIKHRDCFGSVIGVLPPLNLRWVDCKGKYFGNFHPNCWGWRTTVDQGCEPIARFYCGLITVRLKDVVDPLFGRGVPALWAISRENPIEMLDRYRVRNGDLAMYVAYGGEDEFNIDAQVESFLYLAHCRGIHVDVGYLANGRHDRSTAIALFPGIRDWLAPLLAPYSPPLEIHEVPSPHHDDQQGAKCTIKK
jgi:S-formylglutathione hydrolase FrmB